MKKFLIALAILIFVPIIGVLIYTNFTSKPAPKPTELPASDKFVLAFGDVTIAVGQPYFYIDGETNNINNTDLTIVPIIQDGRTAVPLEIVEASFKVKSSYDIASSTITITSATVAFDLVMQIGSNSYTINGQTKTTDSPPFLYNNNPYVPLKFITDNSNCQTSYDDTTKQITITDSTQTITPDQQTSIKNLKTDSYNAMQLATAAAKLVAFDPTFSQAFDFSRQVTIDINLVKPYLANPKQDFSTILTGTAPWIISTQDQEYLITDSSSAPKVYFQGEIDVAGPPTEIPSPTLPPATDSPSPTTPGLLRGM